MLDQEFLKFVFRILYKEYFGTKKRMAKVLGVIPRTLKKNFQQLGDQKGASRAAVNLFIFCCQNNININELYRKYQQSDDTKRGTTITRWMKKPSATITTTAA